jgi:hypothetical protein
MRIGLIIIVITLFIVANIYHDNKFTNSITLNIKYIKMVVYAFMGFSLYLFVNKNPTQSRGIFTHANDIIKYLPIDKNTSNILTPLIDLTKSQYTTNNSHTKPQMNRILHSGGTSNKRSVSETKKKYVASEQNWSCGHCKSQLKATFEIDHIIELQHGGTNHISNLVALCCECHKDKTMRLKL